MCDVDNDGEPDCLRRRCDIRLRRNAHQLPTSRRATCGSDVVIVINRQSSGKRRQMLHHGRWMQIAFQQATSFQHQLSGGRRERERFSLCSHSGRLGWTNAISCDVMLRLIPRLCSRLIIHVLALHLLAHHNTGAGGVGGGSGGAKAEWPKTTTTTSEGGDKHKQQAHGGENIHPSLFVDTKYWIRDTEFGEQVNWRQQRKPCTLFERIKMNELAAVSMGDSLDGLSGVLESTNIRDLTLATDGMLLLEEDTPSDQLDPLFVQTLQEAGECLEGGGGDDELFEFQPNSDHMSWFNPANWASELNDAEIVDWIPESHRIPCSEDIVVLGSRHRALWPTLEANERSKTLSFKVNFRPSEALMSEWPANGSVNGLRVSRLKIGEQSYNQRQFETLLNHYEGILFEFNSSSSVLKAEDGFAYPSHLLFSIDESSIQPDTSYDLCLDEAGCLCGNEQANVMKVICSFNEPLEPNEHPCLDPIPTLGYCNKICASTITISMDPTRFSEKFIASLLNRMLTNGETADYFGENVFTGARRTSETRYEITFRHVPSSAFSERIVEVDGGGWLGSHMDQHYQSTLGREREFAELVYNQLNDAATKSFYGIKSIQIKSSVYWRKNNRLVIFWISYTLLTMLVLLLFTQQSLIRFNHNERLVSSTKSVLALNWLTTLFIFKTKTQLNDQSQDQVTFVRYADPVVTDDYGSTSGIPLLKMIVENEDPST